MEILLVDDEPSMFKTLAPILEAHGYEVRIAMSGRSAIDALEMRVPDLILLDVMMPQMDGYETCLEIRKRDKSVPIIFLSALDGELDQVRGLEVGADDYVLKSTSEDILLARIHLAIDRERRLSAMRSPMGMTRTETLIYRLLKSHKGKVFSYRDIFAEIFGEGYYADEGTLRAHISRMRKKMPPAEEIKSLRGSGFVFV